ncbi:NTP transferase domain-containing protein [Pararhizobium mangrovi]|uniref:4-diphosphocytidyl-2C-methyl-D-erythritol kinase n=1 Tax=Pararhizobium mangrovi TaxID=2590452 RepID=A0A506TXL4_9HYPH|nr:molybdopterin-binding/glycosyltransferase family 2 protein [Pararhizobium mangrovi]TPW26813.1 4-diphosphocytidyl-2C-methyl-D-erythritol kinase [Pararhizobium mangrovi]
MRFGETPLGEAQGAILAHALKTDALHFKKGRVLSADDVDALRSASLSTVIAAVLDDDDVIEDAAAERLGRAMTLSGMTLSAASTGRLNLFAAQNGLFCADRAAVDRLNAVDPAITFACLDDHVPVLEGAMVATIKIIPLAVPGASLAAAESVIATAGLATVKAFRPLRVGLVATRLPSLKATVMDKTADLLRSRLAPSGSALTVERRVAHACEPVREALSDLAETNDLVVLFGASAVVDAEDVIPAAIRAAGGTVEHVGMPVDPGNLLVLGALGSVPVIGAPGCARSPKENGFDWILNRLLAGERPTAGEITQMGVGGLLSEIATRPRPRAKQTDTTLAVETVLLAAGRASRMGEQAGHKLLARFDGEPLVRRTAETALAAMVGRVHVVVGYRGEAVASALTGLDVEIVENPAFGEGMASSLAAGTRALSGNAAGVLVLLADMPGIRPADINRLVEAFRAHDGNAIVRAAVGGRPGNPVILPRAAFQRIEALTGDVGARSIVESQAFEVVTVEIGEAARLDVDTPQAVIEAGGILETGTTIPERRR